MNSLETHYPAFAALVRECTGQEADFVGETTLARAVREGMALSHAKDPQEYLTQLRANRSTLQRFINAVTVGESWFFRDEAPFTFLKHWLIRRTQPQSARIEMLSLPCAAGEEAYSMAMTADEAGLTLAQCRIEGVDINTTYLRRAREAEYRANAFRGFDKDRLYRYFDASENTYVLKPHLKKYVTFFHGSVVEPDARLLQQRYDVILFRNLLIYLSLDARRQALTVVRNLLKPDGVLIVGHAETGLMAAAGFVPEGTAHSFAFCHAPIPLNASNSASKISARLASVTSFPSSTRDSKIADRSSLPRDTGTTLSEVEQLANAGNIEAARQRCSWLLATTNNDPDVSYLCAIVAEAAGEDAYAEMLFRETIKLCPNHYPALIHLAASLASRGDEVEAVELRQRAQRLAQQADPSDEQ